jgi:hypothetical protein
MPHVGSEIDANFYRLIHQMLGTQRHEDRFDRRSEKRHAFTTAQRVARWDGSRFPEADQFVPIQCRDLTRGGFSFLAASEPRFSTLVVEFGIPPHVLYIAAQIVRSVPVIYFPSGEVRRRSGPGGPSAMAGPDGEPGAPMFLVGCRFTRRLRRPG